MLTTIAHSIHDLLSAEKSAALNGAPVGAELEFEDDARGHSEGEVDAEKEHPELGHCQPLGGGGVAGFAAAVIDGLHDCHNHGEAQGERHEEPVIHGREGPYG